MAPPSTPPGPAASAPSSPPSRHAPPLLPAKENTYPTPDRKDGRPPHPPRHQAPRPRPDLRTHRLRRGPHTNPPPRRHPPPTDALQVAAARRATNTRISASKSRHPSRASSTPTPPTTLYPPYARLPAPDKPPPASAHALRKHRFGRAAPAPAPATRDPSSAWLRSPANKLRWVKTAYASVLSTRGADERGAAARRFRQRFYDEADVVGVVWKVADALEEGAEKGWCVPWEGMVAERRGTGKGGEGDGLVRRLDGVLGVLAVSFSFFLSGWGLC